MNDEYTTLSASGEGEYTEKRSRFLSFVFPAKDEEAAQRFIADFRRRFHDARHVCWAYRIRRSRDVPDCGTERSSDDGEPSGTAGRPLLQQLVSAGLVDVVLVVVRYFGGVKLGTGPLAAAYKYAAREALSAAVTEVLFVQTRLYLSATYAETEAVERALRAVEAVVEQRDYADRGVNYTFLLRPSRKEYLTKALPHRMAINTHK